MAENGIRDKVAHFIRNNYLYDNSRTIDGDTSLLGSGIIDSTGILEIIGFLETTYELKFQDSELIGDNFDSIDKITAFLGTKLNGRH